MRWYKTARWCIEDADVSANVGLLLDCFYLLQLLRTKIVLHTCCDGQVDGIVKDIDDLMERIVDTLEVTGAID